MPIITPRDTYFELRCTRSVGQLTQEQEPFMLDDCETRLATDAEALLDRAAADLEDAYRYSVDATIKRGSNWLEVSWMDDDAEPPVEQSFIYNLHQVSLYECEGEQAWDLAAARRFDVRADSTDIS